MTDTCICCGLCELAAKEKARMRRKERRAADAEHDAHD